MSIDREVREVIRDIETKGDPRNMTKAEYVEFLEGVVSECEMRLEGARAELADE